MRDIDKIQRQVHFIQAPAFDSEDKTGINNKWNYNRAPDGYVFKLVKAQISNSSLPDTRYGIVAFFDGHEYTHWNIWPGVESREYLARVELHNYTEIAEVGFELWECKEYTLAVRSTSADKVFKACVIVYYYLVKMNWLERLYYAVIQPKGDRYKKTLGVTIEQSED